MRTSLGHVALASLLVTSAQAVQLFPVNGADPRIRVVPYVDNQVTEVKVQRGTATRIILEDGEKILPDGAATGFPSECGKADLEWCVRAAPGGNQILVKPQDGATHNNLELRTNRRDYSLRFWVIADESPHHSGRQQAQERPTHRLIFQYPTTAAAAEIRHAAPLDIPVEQTPQGLLAAARPSPRNWRYSMQALAGSDDIVPELVFDDGRFTYFRFPANREMPTIFYVSAAGEEGRINFHIDPHAPDTVVVERMSRRFVLRLGHAAIGIWNDAFDAYGVPPRDGTTVDGVARIMRKE
jgi:type IV secretion system protein VirB9